MQGKIGMLEELVNKKDCDISALQEEEKILNAELKAMKEESARFINDQVGHQCQ